MERYVRLSLPEDVAADLLEDETAVRPLTTRGVGLAEAISMTVDSVNVASAVVSVMLGAATLKRMADAFLRRRRNTNERHMSMAIEAHGRRYSISVDLDSPGAADELVGLLRTALNVA